MSFTPLPAIEGFIGIVVYGFALMFGIGFLQLLIYPVIERIINRIQHSEFYSIALERRPVLLVALISRIRRLPDWATSPEAPKPDPDQPPTNGG